MFGATRYVAEEIAAGSGPYGVVTVGGVNGPRRFSAVPRVTAPGMPSPARRTARKLSPAQRSETRHSCSAASEIPSTSRPEAAQSSSSATVRVA